MSKRSLSCLSPDGRTIFSLKHYSSKAARNSGGNDEVASFEKSASPNYNAIAIDFLPLDPNLNHDSTQNVSPRHGDGESASTAYTYSDNPEARQRQQPPASTPQPRALLPSAVVMSLRKDPPLGLLYCDAQYSMPSSHSSAVQVALYSKSKIWLFLIGKRPPLDEALPYSSMDPRTTSPAIVKITDYYIRSSLQPFESYLLHLTASAVHSSASIVRVRGAPSQSQHCSDQYMAPSGCLALLTTEGTLALYHPPVLASTGNSYSHHVSNTSELMQGIVTTPVSMSSMMGYVNTQDDDNTNDGGEEDSISVTDFCFGVSTSIMAAGGATTTVDPSTMGELNVYFLCRNGDVYGASPVIFDHAAIKTSSLKARQEYIQYQLDHVLSPEEEEDDGTDEKKMSQAITLIGGQGQDDRLKTEALRRGYRATTFWIEEVFDNVSSASSASSTGLTNKTALSSAQRGSQSYQYSTARLFSSSKNSSAGAGSFPIQIQAPLLYNRQNLSCGEDGNDDDDSSTPCGDAVVIEALPCGAVDLPPGMAAFCIGRQPLTPSTMEVQVDVCVVTQPLLPRFRFESEDDRDALDEHCAEGRGVLVDTLLYDFGDEAYPSAEYEEEYLERHDSVMYLDVVVDPVRPYLIHVATVFGIFTLSLGSVPQALHRIRRNIGLRSQQQAPSSGEDDQDNTFAFSCLALGASFSGVGFQGTVVSGDAQFGHILISQLTNGQTESVNVTAAIYTHQAATKSEKSPPSALTLSAPGCSSKKGSEILDSLGPFVEVSVPLIQRVSQGLSSTGRIGGSKIAPKDADEATVSAVLQTKTAFENEVVLPLKELYMQTRNREKVLHQVNERQKDQLKKLQAMVNDLQHQSKALAEKAGTIQQNDTALSQRAASVLTASRALLPKITQKEYEYFEQLKRWDGQTLEWEAKVKDLRSQTRSLCDSVQENTTAPFVLDPQTQQMIGSLLDGEDSIISNSKRRALDIQRSLKQMAVGLKLEKAP